MIINITNADQPYNCIDSKGNKVITNNPLDGMKCESGETEEEKLNIKTRKDELSGNLEDICNNLSRKSEAISEELKSYDELRSEIQKEQFEIKKDSYRNKWSPMTESAASRAIREKQDKMNREMSLLYEERNMISNDLRKYKCSELQSDLSRLNRSSIVINNSSGSSAGSRGTQTIIMRDNNKSFIYRGR